MYWNKSREHLNKQTYRHRCQDGLQVNKDNEKVMCNTRWSMWSSCSLISDPQKIENRSKTYFIYIHCFYELYSASEYCIYVNIIILTILHIVRKLFVQQSNSWQLPGSFFQNAGDNSDQKLNQIKSVSFLQ